MRGIGGPDRISRLARNERIKLWAAYINGIAISLMAAGVIAPLVSATLSPASRPVWQLGVLFVGCLLISAGLHYVARQALRDLSDD